ncbi:hypothetical protein LJY25_10960 [Hymenobacter sp. BT175]|uniref:L,D-transpeptidase family protein n=1 Tax=Hymenobacter translucens TaxID=2886507 RepID=UPI001D0EE9B4|nr:L,D-transpeptidase family protein [Hymenobacter translucens]MCC2546966.1 hypothetical protein [Hymenobacter translucens]
MRTTCTMRRLILAFLLLPLLSSQTPEPAFRLQQQMYPRVRSAYARCWPALRRRLVSQHIDPARLEVFIRVFKIEPHLEVWARNQGEGCFALLKSYPLAACSGSLGPKRREGDGQVPEGFYTIDRFNPSSLYHLSLGLDYPNAVDRQLGSAKPGGDIFIHGSNVTIGCLPITDAGIEEVYLLALEARAAGQQSLPVHIFPFALTPEALAARPLSRHAAFWQSLVAGYAYFELHRTLPPILVPEQGDYTLNLPAAGPASKPR